MKDYWGGLPMNNRCTRCDKPLHKVHDPEKDYLCRDCLLVGRIFLEIGKDPEWRPEIDNMLLDWKANEG